MAWCACLVWVLGLPPQLKTQQKLGGSRYADPSAVAQLEQCEFIKENKRGNSGLAKILRGFQHAPGWNCSIDYVYDGSHYNMQISLLSVWRELANVTISDPCQTAFGWHRMWTLLNSNLMSDVLLWLLHPSLLKTIKQTNAKNNKSEHQVKSLQSYASAKD